MWSIGWSTCFATVSLSILYLNNNMRAYHVLASPSGKALATNCFMQFFMHSHMLCTISARGIINWHLLAYWQMMTKAVRSLPAMLAASLCLGFWVWSLSVLMVLGLEPFYTYGLWFGALTPITGAFECIE
jgi:hypothetical protein